MTDYWQNRAACAGFPDPEMFFAQHRTELVAQLCEDCPVKQQCGDLGASMYRGVWAGKPVKAKTAYPSMIDPYLKPTAVPV